MKLCWNYTDSQSFLPLGAFLNSLKCKRKSEKGEKIVKTCSTKELILKAEDDFYKIIEQASEFRFSQANDIHQETLKNQDLVDEISTEIKKPNI